MINLITRIYNKVLKIIFQFLNRFLIYFKIHPKVLDSHASLQVIIDKKMSVSRFGNGELDIILGQHEGFQKYDKRLKERLVEVLKSDTKNLAVSIPDVFQDHSRLNDRASKYWTRQVAHYLYHWNKFTIKDKLYYDSLMTRFYMDLSDKVEFPKKSLQLFKMLWNDRDILIVEGKDTRLGYGNDLFDNCKSIERILCPAENAFSRYDEILVTTKKYAADKLILIALGATASVLAYDLSNGNFQAIDIGHLDIEYEWYKMGATKKQAVPNKYVDEANHRKVEELLDETYLKQIIFKL